MAQWQTVSRPTIFKKRYTLEETPMFVQSGAILPLAWYPSHASVLGRASQLPTVFELVCFTQGMTEGETVVSELYEDDGNSDRYSLMMNLLGQIWCWKKFQLKTLK
eukprot:GABV01012219.1.p1 GENE.GABV01012219.1~~GABV01012219.1.p1  ORF type:complete len:106 (+),score=25.11 GABV01012219.1:57-374(+)